MNVCEICGKETKNERFCSKKCLGIWNAKDHGFQRAHEPYPNSGQFQDGHRTWNTGLTKEIDERLARVAIAVGNAQRGVKESSETKQILSELKMGHPWYGGPGKCLLGCKCKKHSLDARKLNSQNVHNTWDSYTIEEKNDRIRKTIIGAGKSPNNSEKKLGELLQDWYPGEWKYVGNGEFILGGKCPDFVNVNGKKQIIELFGDYWHKDDDPQNRINYFGRYGYKTLVIWENELNRPELLKERLLKF